MRIRRIEQADFRSSEYTIFKDFQSSNRGFVDNLSKHDVIVFVSRSGNQLLFIHGITTFGNKSDVRTAISSIRHRLLGGGRWSPERLANYARDVGLKVEGLKLFEERYKYLIDAKASKR